MTELKQLLIFRTRLTEIKRTARLKQESTRLAERIEKIRIQLRPSGQLNKPFGSWLTFPAMNLSPLGKLYGL
jgi:hypothetical protein